MDRSSDAPAAASRVEPPQARPTTSLRSILVRLVMTALLPGVLASCVVLYFTYRSERAQLERNTILTARALMQAVDSELTTARTIAQTLAKSPSLAAKDFAAFHRQAKEIVQTTGIGSNFVLSDATGQQLVNTIRPFPGPLPRHGNPAQLRRVFETGQPIVSDIYIGGVLRRPVMSVDVPVVVAGKIAYDLSIGLFPERFMDVIRNTQLPADWVVAVFDSQGVIAARTHSPEKFVGKQGAPALLQQMAASGEGMVETPTVEGIPVSAVFSRSSQSNWSVAIGIPTSTFFAELQFQILLLAGGMAILLSIGIGMAVVLAQRLAGSIHALTAPALALGLGKPVAVPRLPLKEAEEVGTAIAKASDLLARRNQELEAANRELQDFSYAISHDLTTPLRAIAGYAQIVVAEHGGQIDDDARRMLGRVRDGTLRMELLIASLVDFMHIARCELIPARVDMGELAREVFEELHAASPQRDLHLDLGEMPPAWGDRYLLRRVLAALIANAIKFIPVQAHGQVNLAGETLHGETIYHVIDNGIGFDMRFAGKLFRAFEHLHPAGEFPGLGTGLAVVRRIIGRHGGRVWAEGEVGRGATFHFALPAAMSVPSLDAAAA